MDFRSFIIWVCPVLTIIMAFFTSRIQRYKYERYCIYFVVLFIAFIFDLQTLSFKTDSIDILFSQITLLILADFFWHGIRMRNKFLRISSIVLALILFVVTYHIWIFGGPGKVGNFFTTSLLSHSTGTFKGYHVKKRGLLTLKTNKSDCMELYKKQCFSLVEKKLSVYIIADGYQNAVFSFKWRLYENRIAVDIIGNTDILWTLTDPGLPK